MTEKLTPNILLPEHTTEKVAWYNDQMPEVPNDGSAEYLVVNGKRVEMSELNEADWLILNALYPQGPQRLD